ncbi:hypothetical protein HHK36_016511 [Tetracentron sinense]|uniref:Homeobox domain-containing protein n=1 Tax=Tetracentron sinense TaxID=13715 RepID=A0A835DC04_TETSI|nr:hypothetical protein HHK36_016511 [Tetracentron sinense]
MSPAASTRWCPTPEQLMILEEMYRGGIRTPNASQIQHITAHLSLYGKIEGKNVFYWFQNHKARDRQKLRRKLSRQQLQDQQQQSHHHLLHQFESSSSVALQQPSHYNSPYFLPLMVMLFGKPVLPFVEMLGHPMRDPLWILTVRYCYNWNPAYRIKVEVCKTLTVKELIELLTGLVCWVILDSVTEVIELTIADHKGKGAF